MKRALMVALIALLYGCSGSNSSGADGTSSLDATTDLSGADLHSGKDTGELPDTAASCNVSGYQQVELTTLQKEMPTYDGQPIVVCAKGTLSIGCTGVACSPENPCCGGCGGGLQLGSTISLAPADGSSPYSCSGNGCMTGMTCTPWPQAEMENYRCYFGTFTQSVGGITGKLLVDHALENCSP